MLRGICLLPLVLAHRNYLPAWSSSFFRFEEVKVKHLGLVNVETVFFGTSTGISSLHDGLLTPVVELHHAELTAFHMCHHRSSIFYETLAKDGGVLSIYEYSLLARESVKVAVFQETVAALSLSCVDQLLLRSSRANLVAIGLNHEKQRSMLMKFQQDYLSSLAVAFPADAVQHAEVYAVVPRNRSVVKLRLHQDSVNLHVSDIEELLAAGEGSDGSLDEASVLEPIQVAWLHGKLLLADKCSLRQVSEKAVWTLLGGECSENETLRPAPWSASISPALGLAAESEAAAGQMALLLTAHQVIQVMQEETCAEETGDTCVQAGCGWAEGAGQHRCFACQGLRTWAERERPMLDPCILEAPQPQARYDLTACGCTPPTTSAPSAREGDAMWIFVRLVGFFGSLGVGAAYCYRRQRRQLDGEIYMPAPNVQFHTFNDHGYVRYDESDEPFS